MGVFIVSYGVTPELQHNVCEQKRIPNVNLSNLPSGFPLSDHANFGDLSSFCPLNVFFCHVLAAVAYVVRRRFIFLKKLIRK